MWPFAKKEDPVPLPIFTETPDGMLVFAVKYYISNIAIDQKLEADRSAPGLSFGRGFVLNESRQEAIRNNTILLNVLDEMQKRIKSGGIEAHPDFTPFHNIIDCHHNPERNRVDPIAISFDAGCIAPHLSQAILGTVTAGRPLPLGSELAVKQNGLEL